ncbi:thiamine pyrophosphate protein TPP binding domain-containing protein [Vibrio sinaloensis DSM 21326]|uniref:Thiamine pyrophosphate protein TPP binding domain-containing protein n=1 Tax=Vibrio sinaloensis DSM 21326 TaxID=945550 RepID=E8M576_PHOS4|nr:thiamine pyrophosphate-binding protein [Vibrio sinaloensis]EGA70927.1 thiamine pyrophosphate protein TPP binding domain-containing protein [Vibrio sinaloensis DSM 21326]
MMRVADYIFEKLSSIGVKTPFVVTGRGALFLNDAIAKRTDMDPCFVHHEQSASFAAIAVSETTDTIGCAVVSTGCASTNTITGVLSGWQDGLPAIFVSGQNTLAETTRYTGKKLRTYGQQEADIVELVKPITKYAVMITDPQTIRYELEKALHLANEGRKGPVWIDVPLDIQNMRVDPDQMVGFSPMHKSQRDLSVEIEQVAKDISAARRPVVLIGSGIKHSKTEEALADFVEKYQIPLVYTASGADAYGSKNDLSIGSFGSMGCSRAGAFAVQNSDYLLVLGSRLTSMTTGVDYCKFARNSKVVVVDIDPEEHNKDGVKIDQLVHADLKRFWESIASFDINTTDKEWVDKCVHWKQIFKSTHKISSSDNSAVDLYDLADSLSVSMASNAVFVCDSGFADVILPTNIDFSNSQTCVHPVSQGAMGFALPAALGIEKCSGRPTIVVVGDGSIMMNLQELQSISDQKANIKIFVVNNNAYAIIRRRQKELFRRRTIGTDDTNGVNCPDFSKIADCFNFTYCRIDNSDNLTDKVSRVLEQSGPVLCEVMGLEDQQYVEVAYAKTASKKYVRRPLEDQWPFLDRETFLEEMIIETIDQ